MAFLLSRCVGLVTPDPGVASDFYQDQFEMVAYSSDVSIELAAGPLRLYLDPGKTRPLVFEMVTDDLLEARHEARKLGFEELVWRGEGQSCLVRDPFGFVFNIHEDRHGSLLASLEAPSRGFVKGCLGGQCPAPREAAGFYEQVLDSPVSKLPDGSYILDSNSLRLRFRGGGVSVPLIWTKSETPLKRLAQNGCRLDDRGILTDPFGLSWCPEIATPAVKAVCSPL